MSPETVHREVAQTLRTRIRERTYPPGGRLPSEQDLAQELGVARDTIRLALGLLRAEGLLRTYRGRGTFVAESPPLRERGSAHAREHRERAQGDVFTTSLAEHGRTGQMRITAGTWPAPEEVIARLGLEDGADAVVRQRIEIVDDKPSALRDDWYPTHIAAGTELENPTNIERGSNRVLAELGHEVTHEDHCITARKPTGQETRTLDIPPDTPILEIWKTGYTANETPIVVYHDILPADRHIIDYTIHNTKPQNQQ
jgi:GntR family transcriptional regulator